MPLFLVLVLLSGMLYIPWLDASGTVNKIEIHANIKTDRKAAIQQILKNSVSYTSFLWLHTKHVEKNIKTQDPWVRSVEIQHKWPRTLNIKLEDYNAIALWNNVGYISDGNHLIVDKIDSVKYKKLPVLIADIKHKKEVIEYYGQINRILFLHQLSFKAFIRDKGGSWIMQVEDAEVLLGHSDIIDRASRFIQAYKKENLSKTGLITRIDARYHNGIAVSWHEMYKYATP